MAEQENREAERVVDDVVDEFARAHRLRVVYTGTLTIRRPRLEKEITIWSYGGQTKVRFEAREVWRWLGGRDWGRPIERWEIGQTETGGPDLRERVWALLEQAWERSERLTLEELRRLHEERLAPARRRIEPMLEEYATALGGVLHKGPCYRLLWPEPKPRGEMTVEIADGFQVHVRARVGGRRLNVWEKWGGSLRSLRLRDLGDESAQRALLDRFVRVTKTLIRLAEFAEVRGCYLVVSEPKDTFEEEQYAWIARWEQRESQHYVGIELDLEELRVLAGEQEAWGLTRQTLGTVAVSAPDLCEKTMALVEQAWPVDWGDMAKARQRSRRVRQHWWPPQRWRDRRARMAWGKQFELVLREFAAAQGGLVQKRGECERHLSWPRKHPRARIEFSDAYFADWQSWYRLSISPARRERTGLFRWEWRDVWGRRIVLDGWDDVEGLRAGLARLRVLHETLDQVECWAQSHNLQPRWSWRDPDFHRFDVLTLGPRTRHPKGSKKMILTWLVGKVTVEAQAHEESEGKELGSVTDDAPDFAERVLGLLEQAWEIVKPGGTKDFGE